jgi:acyl dehydratase
MGPGPAPQVVPAALLPAARTVYSRRVPVPSIWPSYARLLTARRPRLAPASAATAEVIEARRIAAPANALAAYRRACAFPLETALPLTYPHALASPLHLALLARPAFPVRALGLVHVRNTIRSLRPIPDGAPVDLRCALGGPRETDRGQEFDLVTEASLDGALAWAETAVLLARKPGAGATRRARTEPDAKAPGAPVARWSLPADLGRRYAAASGDWNPIHLSMPTARLFGFPRAVAHGMWSLARCVAELSPSPVAVTLEAAFKLPVLLPAAVTLFAARDGDATAFALRDGDAVRPHVEGTIRRA